MNTPKAILLLGPTGSGKTPLGELMHRRGLWGRECSHFDFGERLRQAVTSTKPPTGLTPADVAFLRSVLQTGALLEDDRFPVAEAILRAGIAEIAVGDDGLIVLNGLPRHVGQARDVGRIVTVRAVVKLTCPAEVVVERIATNIGGDRTSRCDDDIALVRRKLAVYAEHTAALTGYYRREGAEIRTVNIGPDTRPGDILKQLNAHPLADDAGATP